MSLAHGPNRRLIARLSSWAPASPRARASKSCPGAREGQWALDRFTWAIQVCFWPTMLARSLTPRVLVLPSAARWFQPPEARARPLFCLELSSRTCRSGRALLRRPSAGTDGVMGDAHPSSSLCGAGVQCDALRTSSSRSVRLLVFFLLSHCSRPPAAHTTTLLCGRRVRESM